MKFREAACSRILIGSLILCFVLVVDSTKSRRCKRQSILSQSGFRKTPKQMQTGMEDILVAMPLSLGHLIHLASTDIAISRHLNRLSQSNNCTVPSQKFVEQLQKRYVEDFATSSEIILKRWYEKVGPSAGNDMWSAGVDVVRNPVAVVRLLFRLVHLLQPLVLQLNYGKNSCPENAPALQRLTFYFHGLPMPTVDDFNEIVTSFLNLQQIYDLNPADLADGKVGMMETNIRLSAEQALLIGKKATQEKQYSLARSWLQLAHIMFQAGSTGDNLSATKATEYVAILSQEHDAQRRTLTAGGVANEKMQRYLFEEALTTNFSARPMREVLMEKYEDKFIAGEESFRSEGAYYTFLTTCGKGKTAVYKSTKEVYCYLDTRKHPYLVLLPARVEILSNDPYVVVFRDAIPPTLISPYLNDALTQYLNPAQRVARLGSMRIRLEENNGWPFKLLNVEEAPRPNVPLRLPRKVFRKAIPTYYLDDLFGTALNERVEFLTGLFFRQPASMMVNGFIHGEYGFLHVDDEPEDEAEQGVRIASSIIFMTSVEEGGALAFNNIGLRVPPRLGDMVFWFNLFPNGSVDYRLSHEGCSPLNGVRVVGAKFAWSHVNTFVKKCPKEEATAYSLRD